MNTLVSPGINITEIDFTRVPVTRSSTVAALAGVFTWGPVNERVKIGSVAQLIRRFGTPRKGFNQETFFTAHDYLAYADSLMIVRADGGGVEARPGVSEAFYDVTAPRLTAKYHGTAGNSIEVRIISRTSWDSATDTKTYGTKKPGRRNVGTSASPVYSDLYHVFVIDRLGRFTGTKGKLLERYENVFDRDNTFRDGESIFMVDVINKKSSFIKFNIESTLNGQAILLEELGVLADATTKSVDIVITLESGTDGSSESSVSVGALQTAYDQFSSAEDVSLDLILAGKARGASEDNYSVMANYLIGIANSRKDCVAFISPDRTHVVNNTGNETTAVVEFSRALNPSSYAVVDSGYKYRYDRYNDVYIETPLNGDIAGLCARTDFTNDPWFSPAGYTRGQIKNVIRLTFNPKQADRDALYQADVNPVMTQAGTGTILFGDKTHVLDDDNISAFDRINVRRLFLTIEKVISRAAKNLLFEMNNEFTRAQFLNFVEPYLRDVQGREGIYDFRVVCDESNNTADVIDANQFVGDIYIKPARSINYIQLNFVAVRTGVEFEEVVGSI